jgi:hypothetical protein
MADRVGQIVPAEITCKLLEEEKWHEAWPREINGTVWAVREVQARGTMFLWLSRRGGWAFGRQGQT